MAKPLAPAAAAAAVLAAASLAKHSIEQAKTAYKLAAAFHLERVKLMAPATESYDISRLGACMVAAANELRDPAEPLRAAADKGILEPRHAFGETKASAGLRKACQSVLAELAAASEDLPSQMAAELEAMSARGDALIPSTAHPEQTRAHRTP